MRSHTVPVSFAHDIRPLFRPLDIAHMQPFDVNLGDYAYMADPADDHRHAREVEAFLCGAREPRMPLGGPYWTDEQLRLYDRWMRGGCPP